MVLIFDIGNTSINFGLYENDKLVVFDRLRTNEIIDDNSLSNILERKLAPYKEKITFSFVSSVVPSLSKDLYDSVKKVLNIESKFIDEHTKTNMEIKLDDPAELGADLLCDSIAARKKYGNGLAIVDLGTANKILAINKDGDFEGGIIAPGIKISLRSLVDSASLLNLNDFTANEKVIGKKTSDCISSGIIHGTKNMVIGMVKDFEKELGYPLKVILTGGHAKRFIALLPDCVYDEYLPLDGAYELYKMNYED